jgi:Ankyrin repeats (3 copies)
MTTLLTACQGRLSQVEVPVTHHQSQRLTKLLKAASSCELVSVRRYLSKGGTPDAVVAVDLDGHHYNIPLILAAANQHHGVHAGSLQLLLEAGANVEAIGYSHFGSDRRALHWAAGSTCCSASLHLLLSRGADPMMQSHVDGTSALHIAASHGQVEKCSMLLQASKGNPLELLATGQQTPLRMAVSHGHLAVVKLFHLEHRAELPLDDLDAKGHSLLHSAACGEGGIAHIPVMAFLLSAGLDVNATSTQGHGYTPLSMAIRATSSSRSCAAAA